MKKVALVGLYALNNVGDQIISDAAEYLIREHKPDIRIIKVDMNPDVSEFSGIGWMCFQFSRILIKLSEKVFSFRNKSNFRYYVEYFMWRLRLHSYFSKKIQNVDAVIFAGGGMFKFRSQWISYLVEQIIKLSEQKQIPVMFNAIGIEGYDEEDIRCQRLKKAVNSSCIKIITTRDDLRLLREKYRSRSGIETALVGDPALWARECYSLRNMEEGRKETVGINVIRGEIFKAYGLRLSEKEVMEFYLDLVAEAERRGWKWKLFSNGMEQDRKFGEKLLEQIRERGIKTELLAPGSAEEYVKMIGGFRCVFGARLHACIVSYALDVPAVGLIWNEKQELFSKLIGKRDAFFDGSQINARKIADTMEREWNSRYNCRQREELKKEMRFFLLSFLDGI